MVRLFTLSVAEGQETFTLLLIGADVRWSLTPVWNFASLSRFTKHVSNMLIYDSDLVLATGLWMDLWFSLPRYFKKVSPHY